MPVGALSRAALGEAVRSEEGFVKSYRALADAFAKAEDEFK